MLNIIENKIKQAFKQQYRLVRGTEWFDGDVKQMRKDIDIIIDTNDGDVNIESPQRSTDILSEANIEPLMSDADVESTALRPLLGAAGARYHPLEFACESYTAIRKLTAKLKLPNAFIKRAFGADTGFPIDVEVRVMLGTTLHEPSYKAKIFEWRDGHQINGAPRQRYWLTHLQEIKRNYNNQEVLSYRMVAPHIMVMHLHSELR
jgi:hypothetical protein